MDNLSVLAKHIIKLLWKDGKPMATNFVIGHTYTIEGKKYKATEELYEELVELRKEYDRPFKMIRTRDVVSLIGTRVQ